MLPEMRESLLEEAEQVVLTNCRRSPHSRKFGSRLEPRPSRRETNAENLAARGKSHAGQTSVTSSALGRWEALLKDLSRSPREPGRSSVTAEFWTLQESSIARP